MLMQVFYICEKPEIPELEASVEMEMFGLTPALRSECVSRDPTLARGKAGRRDHQGPIKMFVMF